MPVSPVFCFMGSQTKNAADTAAGSVSGNPGPIKGWPALQSRFDWEPYKIGNKYIQETSTIRGSHSSAASFHCGKKLSQFSALF